MAEAATKLSLRNEENRTGRPAEWRPFESLRQEVDRLFEDFQLSSWRSPFGRGLFDVQPFWRGEVKAPAVDIVDTDKAYEIIAELPGMDESNIDVKLSDGTLTIKGEKRDEMEEKKKDYYLSERRYGSFQQDRGKLQEWRAHGHVAENAAGAEERKEDRDQKGLNSLGLC
jgi:HSP20 family protein